MWLPVKVYERLPHFWLLVGIVFILSGLYLGLDYSLTYFYLAVGALCVVWSVIVLAWRAQHRNQDSAAGSQAANDDK